MNNRTPSITPTGDTMTFNLSHCRKARALGSLLAHFNPDAFSRLDGLTWPDGQCILVCRSCERLLGSNPNASAKPLIGSEYFINTGHDFRAAQRMIELIMRNLGYGVGTINVVKAMLVPWRVDELAAQES